MIGSLGDAEAMFNAGRETLRGEEEEFVVTP
jgi:hypothetical protein